jgi:phage-related protein
MKVLLDILYAFLKQLVVNLMELLNDELELIKQGFNNLLSVLMEALNDLGYVSLNSIWVSLGITDLSFLFSVKIIFFIVFVLLNICLFYIENLNTEYKNKNNPESHLKSGISPEVKKIGKRVLIGVGLYIVL